MIKTFLHFLADGRKLTFRETHAESNRIANGLLAIGIGKGTHVASLLDNSPEQVLIYLAIGKIGAVSVPINTAARGSFLSYYLDQSQSSYLIIESSILLQVRDELTASKLTGIIVAPSMECVEENEHPYLTLSEIISQNEDDVRGEVKHSDLALITYTSGTTGPSKGTMYSQAGALSFGANVVKTIGATSRDIYYVCFPLFPRSRLECRHIDDATAWRGNCANQKILSEQIS